VLRNRNITAWTLEVALLVIDVVVFDWVLQWIWIGICLMSHYFPLLLSIKLLSSFCQFWKNCYLWFLSSGTEISNLHFEHDSCPGVFNAARCS
jgi:hypothetical protein